MIEIILIGNQQSYNRYRYWYYDIKRKHIRTYGIPICCFDAYYFSEDKFEFTEVKTFGHYAKKLTTWY